MSFLLALNKLPELPFVCIVHSEHFYSATTHCVNSQWKKYLFKVNSKKIKAKSVRFVLVFIVDSEQLFSRRD